MNRLLFLSLLSVLAISCENTGSAQGPVTEVSSESAARDVVQQSDPVISTFEFPRSRAIRGGTATIYEPQIEGHENYERIVGWIAVSVLLDDSDQEFEGALQFEARIVTNFNDRLVTIFDRQITDAYFPSASEAQSSDLAARIREQMQATPEVVPFDVILAYLVDTDVPAAGVQVSMDPPPIYYRESLAALLISDGEPVFAPTDVEGLSFAINTNWDLFQIAQSEQYYLVVDDRWATSAAVEGPWQAASQPPALVSQLPDEPNWAAARAAQGTGLGAAALADIIFTDVPAELILSDGAPRYESIPGTTLMHITNSESDVFFDVGTNRYYFLVAGRWFAAEKVDESWVAAGHLPETFSSIPENHPRAHVRASVPGTVEAKFAVLQTQIPIRAVVQREGTRIDVHYAGEPAFEVIEGTNLHRAINTPFDVIQWGSEFYAVHDGVWFRSDSAEGPWEVADSIPDEIYNIPASSPSHHVTYVYIYDSDYQQVYTGYTSGYHHVYLSFTYGLPVYGAGYYWNPYYYYDPFHPYPYYPIYYGYPYAYGVGAFYNGRTGTYGRAAIGYGPWGGYGRSASYNPTTGRYARAAGAWGYEGGGFAREAYNPRTGISSGTQQYANYDDYESWGSSYVQRGEDWAVSGRYRNEDGAVRGIATSEGDFGLGGVGEDNRGGIARRGDDLYAGANGNLYRKTDDGWQQRTGNDWSSVNTDAARETAADRIASSNIDVGAARETAAGRIARSEFDTSSLGGRRDRATSSTASLDRAAAARSYGNQRYQSYRSSRANGTLNNRGTGSRNFGGFSGRRGRF